MNHPAPPPQIIRIPIPPATLDALRIRFDDRVSMGKAVRVRHGHDESAYDLMLSDTAVFTQTTEGVAAVARLCFEHGIPLTPYSAGSSLKGHLLAVAGGVDLDLSQMNHVLSVHPENLTVAVEPGVARKQLSTEIRDTGLSFPIDPDTDASIGDMCVTRTSGTNAVHYDMAHENILNLTVITADGRIIETIDHTRRSSAGYDLTRLFTGSEGTLGIIARITLKLYPQPEAVSATVYTLPSMDDTVFTVIDTIQTGVPTTRAEFVDTLAIRTTNQYDKLTLPELPMLFFEFHGSEHDVQEQAETVQQITAGHKSRDFEWTTRPKDRSHLWDARHNTYFVFLQLKPDCRAVTTDMCVSISHLAECVVEVEGDLLASALQLPAPIVGHVGDSGFHVAPLVGPNKSEELEEAGRINQRIVARAIAMGGTCTGEHGVGLHKVDFLIAGHGNGAIDLMRSIKRALDPRHVLSPGEIFHL